MAGLGSEVIIGGFLRDTMDVETYVVSVMHLHFCWVARGRGACVLGGGRSVSKCARVGRAAHFLPTVDPTFLCQRLFDVAQLLFPLFVAIGLTSRSVFGLPLVVVGLWKMGFPETVT